MIKAIKLLAICVLATSCSTGNHADFEKNTATAKKYFELHQAENPEEALCKRHIISANAITNDTTRSFLKAQSETKGKHLQRCDQSHCGLLIDALDASHQD